MKTTKYEDLKDAKRNELISMITAGILKSKNSLVEKISKTLKEEQTEQSIIDEAIELINNDADIKMQKISGVVEMLLEESDEKIEKTFSELLAKF